MKNPSNRAEIISMASCLRSSLKKNDPAREYKVVTKWDKMEALSNFCSIYADVVVYRKEPGLYLYIGVMGFDYNNGDWSVEVRSDGVTVSLLSEVLEDVKENSREYQDPEEER